MIKQVINIHTGSQPSFHDITFKQDVLILSSRSHI